MPPSRVTLTFDNGPTPGVTEQVLETLADREVRATFFVCGKQLLSPDGPGLMRRAADEGHWVGNHTMTHSSSLGEDSAPATLRSEIGEVQELIGSYAHEDRFFRPRGAGGVLDRRLLSRQALAYLADGAYSIVLWNSVPHDWDDPLGWIDRALADAAGRDWTAVVVHDIASGAMDHLAEAIDRFREAGHELVQELPSPIVPMRRGRLEQPVDHLMPHAA